MIFYLGTHETSWLPKTTVPLFVSHRRLARNKRLPKPAAGRWALDSGGFSELSLYGKWVTGPKEYAVAVRRYIEGIGRLDFAAIQDWMVEAVMLAKTGLTIEEHQARTVQSFLVLRDLAPEVPWLPVLQGWTYEDYDRCIQLYSEAGVDLWAEPRVGVGTMCRRQATPEAVVILRTLANLGLRLHGFGFKSGGVIKAAPHLESADSMAWSFAARKRGIRLPDHTHVNCGNCREWAEQWWRSIIVKLPHDARNEEAPVTSTEKP